MSPWVGQQPIHKSLIGTVRRTDFTECFGNHDLADPARPTLCRLGMVPIMQGSRSLPARSGRISRATTGWAEGFRTRMSGVPCAGLARYIMLGLTRATCFHPNRCGAGLQSQMPEVWTLGPCGKIKPRCVSAIFHLVVRGRSELHLEYPCEATSRCDYPGDGTFGPNANRLSMRISQSIALVEAVDATRVVRSLQYGSNGG